MGTNEAHTNAAADHDDDVVGFAVFAKYDGVDGESADSSHDKWIPIEGLFHGRNRL